MPVSVPPLAEQRRIVAKVEELLGRVRVVRERLARVSAILKRFRQSVLAAACSGRLTEDWRESLCESETAAELLERVRAVRRRQHELDCQKAERRDQRQPRVPNNLIPPEENVEDLPELPDLPESWTVVPVKEVAVQVQYGTSVKAEATAAKGVPILRMGNVQAGELDLSDLKYIDPTSENVAAFTLEAGDIVFNRTNSPELVGKAAVFDVDTQYVFASYLIRLKCDVRLVESRLLCRWINSPWGRIWARTVRTDGVSQSNINATKLTRMPFPLPPLAEQREIVRRVDAMFALADKIEARVQAATLRVEKSTQAILAKAFRGELVPTEAELARQEGRDYEPASVLLERIRAERAQSPTGRQSTSPRRRRSAASTVQEPSDEEPDQDTQADEPPIGLPSRSHPNRQHEVEKMQSPRTNARGRQEESPPPIDETGRDKVMAAIRDVFSSSGPLDRDEAIRQISQRLGYGRVGQRIRKSLDGGIRTAVRRGILHNEGGVLSLLCRSIEEYDRDFLVEQLLAGMGSTWWDREDLIEGTARWLGFRHTGQMIRAALQSVINGAIRRDLLEPDGQRVRRTR